ncbi:glycosyltransferase family 4 protein, partial [Candidatus Poribacteria bacterium]|nr:glycosyltransferase family 4 protein [Candidatus Poribacteria bacterium]
GEGAEKEKLKKIAIDYGLNNVKFIDQQSKDVIPYFYQASDACLVPLINQPLFSAVIPSKVFEIMSCARPIILSVKGEACSMIQRANAGITIEPENHQQLVNALLKLYRDKDLADTLGNNGRNFIQKYFSREKMAKDYIEILTSIQREG